MNGNTAYNTQAAHCRDATTAPGDRRDIRERITLSLLRAVSPEIALYQKTIRFLANAGAWSKNLS